MSPTPEQWLWRIGADTGVSSETIWHTLTGIAWTGRHSWPDLPHDPDDFGRCYRLLLRFPGWRKRLGEVAEQHPEWAPLVARWDDLERLYVRDRPTGKSAELYALLQELRAKGGR